MKKWMAVVLVGVCSMGGMQVFGANGTKTAQIAYQDIKLVVDGVPIAIESNQEPFIYNGTTYLPVRAVGEAFDKNVSWDGNSKTVYIGENPNQKNYLMTVCPPYEESGVVDDETFKMGGKTYANGFRTDLTRNKALFNLDGKYSVMEFDLGKVDSPYTHDSELKIYLDGNLTEMIEIGKEDLPKYYTIALNHALQLKIEVDGGVGLANIEVR